MRFEIKTFVAILSFALYVLAGCKGKEESKPVITPEVNVVAAGQKTVPVYTEYIGQTYGSSDVEIKSRTEGWIVSMHFTEGDMVKQGQLLYVIDDLAIQTRIDAAVARLAETKTLMTKAKADLDRVEPLAKMNALSQRDLDAAVASYEASKSEVEAAKAALENAKIELGYTRIISPITGIIGLSQYQVGDYTTKGSMAKPMNTVSALGSIRVRFPISESEYLRFNKRLRGDKEQIKKLTEIPVELILGDGSTYPEKGKIDLANRQVDPSTGSLLVQAIFGNDQRIIRPGQYVKVRFQTDQYSDAIMIPQQAVSILQSVSQVFVLGDSNKVSPRVIKTGARVGSNWIITEGLKAGEKVAIIGSLAVSPTIPVKPISMNWNYDSTSRN